MGLKWMKSTGVPQIENLITEDSNVFILMGVNDVDNPNGALNYLEYINAKAIEWTAKGAKVYYVGIMPIKRDDKYATNAQIIAWNEIMSKQMELSIILSVI